MSLAVGLVALFWAIFLPVILMCSAKRRQRYDSPVERAVRWNQELYGDQFEVN